MTDKGPGVRVVGPEGSVEIPTESWDAATTAARAVMAAHDGVDGAVSVHVQHIRR